VLHQVLDEEVVGFYGEAGTFYLYNFEDDDSASTTNVLTSRYYYCTWTRTNTVSGPQITVEGWLDSGKSGTADFSLTVDVSINTTHRYFIHSYVPVVGGGSGSSSASASSSAPSSSGASSSSSGS